MKLSSNRLFLLAVALISGFLLFQAMGWPLQSQYTIGPGFLPAVMLVVIIVCCVLLFIFDKSTADIHLSKRALVRLGLYLVGLVAFILLMQHLGIISSVAIFTFYIVFAVERHSWLEGVEVALATAFVVWAIFGLWLNIPITIFNFL